MILVNRQIKILPDGTEVELSREEIEYERQGIIRVGDKYISRPGKYTDLDYYDHTRRD